MRLESECVFSHTLLQLRFCKRTLHADMLNSVK